MKILILNSAHGKYSTGADSWIQATVNAVDALAAESHTLICSTDPNPWNLVTCLAGKTGINIELLVRAPHDSKGKAEFSCILDEYKLDISKTKPVYIVETGRHNLHYKELWQYRDRIAVKSTDIIYPVSIRPGGRLEHLMSEEAIKSKVSNEFRIDYQKERYKPRYSLKGRTVNPLPRGEWLVHWTRTSHGLWPGEKAWQFYHDLLENPEVYVRSAEATLARILSEMRIRGSSWKLPGGECAVALTALSIEEALPLMRWRRRFVRYSFEPYGIAVKRSVMLDLGVREVSYEQGDNKCDRLYIHAPGEKTDWTREREWRIRGDLPLYGIDTKDFIALVPGRKAGNALLNRLNREIRVHEIFED